MSEITGNKGEWSEIYVFLKLLAKGRLYGADGNVNRRDDIYYDISRIIRNEGGVEYQYVLSDDGLNAEVRIDDDLVLEIKRSRILEEAEYLLDNIRSSTGAFSVQRTSDFMTEIRCHKLKAPSKDKSDITIQIHDHRTGMNPTLGFSIKSMLGSPSTLVNASGSTNFVFKLRGDVGYLSYLRNRMHEDMVSKKRRNLNSEFSQMIEDGVIFEFSSADNPVMQNNLRLLDGDMSSVVAEMLKLYYIEGVNRISDQVRILNKRNPHDFDGPDSYPYYEYKVKTLLVSYALGMQSSKPWNGIEDANGGYIIVRNDGEVLCYHLYNRNDFEDYLFKNTVLDTPSTSRHDFSYVTKDLEGNFILKLNLQIRFVNQN